jgi:peptide/nickel transport system substrate-binding protein
LSIDGLDIKYVDTPTVYYLSFDFREQSDLIYEINPFSILEVRKAIYHSVNIDEIIDEYLYGFGTNISQFVSPLIFGYNPDIQRAPYDLKLARQFMKDAGLESGFNATLDCPDENLMINISYEIIEQLLDINISVDLNILSVYDWLVEIYDRNTSFYLGGWIPSGVDGGEIFDYMLRSVDDEKNIGSFNAGFYSNSEVDRIGELVTWTMDSSERQELIQQGFAIAMEDVAWIPLFSIQWIYGLSDDIEFNPTPDLNIRVEDIKFKG